VAEGAQTGGSQRTDEDLLQLAMSRPAEAIARARRILAGRPAPYEASVAHHAAGIVLRDTGDIRAAVRELRTALSLAQRTGSAERQADVLGTLGVALVQAGHTAKGFEAFDSAIRLSSGTMLGRALHRRGAILWIMGRYASALEDLRRAVDILEPAGDILWTARALSARGLAHLAAGSPTRADADFAAAGLLYAQTGQDLEQIRTVLNRGSAAFESGDLPAALSFFDEADRGFTALNVPSPTLSQVRCAVLLAAGLSNDALTEADAALQTIEQVHGQSTKRAELFLMAAQCAAAAGQPQTALERARTACRLFQSQQSDWWLAHAELLVVQAQHAVGPSSLRLLHAAERVAVHLAELRSTEATQASLLAGRVALDLHRLDDAHRHLAAAAASKRRGPALSRATSWLSEALLGDADGESRRVLAACSRGLQILDQYRWTLGASELRAQVTAHGAELAALAQRHAVRMHRPRTVLAWSERWRATALAVPAVRPPANGGFDADLAALRQVTSRVEEARRQGQPTAALEREQLRLEKVVRATSLRTSGTATSGPSGIDVPDLLDALGSTHLVEIVDIDGMLHVLLCGAGRVRQFTAGSIQDVARASDFARFALRRLARARSGDDPQSALAILKAAGPALQQAALGEASRRLPDGPVVVVPPGKLHAVPWSLLPALSDRPHSVAPSATAWLRAHLASPPERRHVTLASGPELVTGGAEVPAIAELYDDVTVLSGPRAAADRVLDALDGAWLAHIAAHGTFRADSPMFSSLRMHDGPLTVYDFERLARAPHRLVLSSCDSGLLAPAGADELLGLVSSLLPLGTAGIVAGVVPLNDRAVVPLMIDLHRSLRADQTLAEALHTIRDDTAGDPARHGAALSLVALGAG
jgi:tetratricopeptide (TPR) repeat protein